VAAPRHTIAVVGGGRLGSALAAALGHAGATVRGPFGRGVAVPPADIVLLCVPDREIATASARVDEGPLVGHCSGILGPAVVAPHEGLTLHPLLTVTGPSTDFRGAAAAIAGSTPRALAAARSLATALGMEPIEVSEDLRPLYHAAASMASNYLVTIEDAAEALARKVGVERRHLVPLARAALDNWERSGLAALTGPIARGDLETVERQRAAVATHASHLLPLWDALAVATSRLAVRVRDGDA
jgi:predicted short-subunit dehydrogenase-like oxidoreductase (DUF2520 family)